MGDITVNDRTHSATGAVSITVNTADHDRSRAVDIGVSGNYDFSFDGTTWVTFKNRIAGVVYPYEVVGVRKTTGSAAPDEGDVVFLY
jgi:hypothetical protein